MDSSAELLKEARKLYPEREFLNLDMLSLEKIKSKFDVIFFVASFHHLENVEDRRKVLK
ncbi:MAG: class I SAM-dependent methyltransferase, partial [Candidatus Peribacteria bacterium]|nr:class I SAM-dependent methyltransferase [Candidatus Peribacteria bacterium]